MTLSAFNNSSFSRTGRGPFASLFRKIPVSVGLLIIAFITSTHIQRFSYKVMKASFKFQHLFSATSLTLELNILNESRSYVRLWPNHFFAHHENGLGAMGKVRSLLSEYFHGLALL